jgi:hypothetical protein
MRLRIDSLAIAHVLRSYRIFFDPFSNSGIGGMPSEFVKSCCLVFWATFLTLEGDSSKGEPTINASVKLKLNARGMLHVNFCFSHDARVKAFYDLLPLRAGSVIGFVTVDRESVCHC